MLPKKMKMMATCIVPFAVLVSCDGNPQLPDNTDSKAPEIEGLTIELASLEGKVRNLPPDVTQELSAGRMLEEEQAIEIKRLEEELAGHQERARQLQADFDTYRANYRMD